MILVDKNIGFRKVISLPCDFTNNMLHMLLKATAARRYHKPVTIFVIVLPMKEKKQRHMNYNAVGNINGDWHLKHTSFSISILLVKVRF